MTPYYKHHIFFCINERIDGRASCNDCNAKKLQDYAKRKIKEMKLSGAGQVRVNKAGCLDRCEEGPVAVVYPAGVWYHFVDEQDIDEICESHLRDGQPVERLMLDSPAKI
jgi:(2Fe-2S) ferredoxin